MRKISTYFISILLLSGFCGANAQDTIVYKPRINIGFDLFGPAYYIADKNILSLEGYLSVGFDTNKAAVIEIGYLDYRYSQYNYDFLSNGFFVKLGIDFNTLSFETSQGGKYYGGVGLRYGLSIFTAETPYMKHENYWGVTESYALPSKSAAHFLEIAPGIRTEIFSNVSIGWTIRLRFLIYSGTGKDLKSIYIPGFGNGTKVFSPGINYYIVFSFPYKNDRR
jgi:hypothetical protein